LRRILSCATAKWSLSGAAARRLILLLASLLVLLSAVPSDAQIFHKKKKQNQSTDASNTAEPDKILYNRAMADVKRGRHEVGRLGLQTLINTYPDSEYLAKAKLAIADSYFKEGGTANMTQAVAGYKDFIVFFPFLPEAAYAQIQVAMVHYREMAKPDRDRTQAKLAEDEFQTFLQKYPKDALAPKAEQHLREVQEVLAEGDFRVGYYYSVKGDSRAAAARLISVARRYPLYSKADTAIWMLGNIFEKSERKDVAGYYYAMLARNYPLSQRTADAKAKLIALKIPVPQPDPRAQARMLAEQNMPHPRRSMVRKSLGILHSGPDVRMAARIGPPNLEPEAETASATDVLSGGNHSTIGGGSGAGTTGIVATITPGKSDSAGATAGAETTASPEENNTGNPPAATDSNTGTNPAAASADSAPATTDSTDGTTSPAGGATTDATAPATDGAAKADGTPDASQTGTAADKKKESSSKKKKGIKKIIPW
jgi:outer membrane protein assembly factor BamD